MMVMRALFHIFDQVFRSIAANKLRSFLTMFGIAWGVASLLLLIGLLFVFGLMLLPFVRRPRSFLSR